MGRLIIEGGVPLEGTIRVSGSKNAAVAAIPAALLARGPSRLENLPNITDVAVFADILRALGASVDWEPEQGVMVIDPAGFCCTEAPYELVKRLRASYYLIGVFLARFGHGQVALPGGCDIGLRPIDQHMKGFRALGAQASMEYGVVTVDADKLEGSTIYLDVTSVGATINIMLAACLAEGRTVIENAAKEPHIVDLANYLNAMGARIQGAGTDVIRIRGVRELHGATHAIIPDEIEAATYMLMAVATGGRVRVTEVIPKHLEAVGAKLRETGAEVREEGDTVEVISRGRPRAANVKTLPYPGFPTDLQQPYVAVMCRARGVSVVQETLFENRFGYANELIRMGASIRVDGRTAIVEGVEKLYGAPVRASDLRGAAALVVAGLSAQGRTIVEGTYHLDRGYAAMVQKLQALGARVARED